jgi:hypothetical protein
LRAFGVESGSRIGANKGRVSVLEPERSGDRQPKAARKGERSESMHQASGALRRP